MADGFFPKKTQIGFSCLKKFWVGFFQLKHIYLQAIFTTSSLVSSYKGELTGMLYLLYNTVVPQFVLHISTAFWIASSSVLIVMSNNKKNSNENFFFDSSWLFDIWITIIVG